MSCYKIIDFEKFKELKVVLMTDSRFNNILNKWSKGFLYGCKFLQLDISTIDSPYNDNEEVCKRNIKKNKMFLEKILPPFISTIKTEYFYLFENFNHSVVEVEKRNFNIEEYIYTVLENGCLVEELKESKLFITSLIPDDPSPSFCISSDYKMGFIGDAQNNSITVFGDELIAKVQKVDFEGISNIKVFESI